MIEFACVIIWFCFVYLEFNNWNLPIKTNKKRRKQPIQETPEPEEELIKTWERVDYFEEKKEIELSI